MPGRSLMYLTVRILGLELLHLEASTEEPEDDDPARDLSGGLTGSTAVGFTPRWEHVSEDEGVER